jgi:glycosyltransferase involved in cell wall biosynthesis
MSSLSATAAICTYNGANRIGEVINRLSCQSLPNIQWELLVINNASTDDTQLVCEDIFSNSPINAKVINELQSGLIFARRRATFEAKGEIICFIDDDNYPADNYLQSAVTAFKNISGAGVIGGKVLPKWECSPTQLVEAVADFALSICDYGEIVKEITTIGGGIVGAGMCVRRNLLRRIFDSEVLLDSVSGRKGTNLMSGEDLAISVLARKFGYKTIYDPQLKIEHFIPARRMEKDYLLELFEGIGRGQAATRRIYDWKARGPLALAIAVKDFFRWGKGMARKKCLKSLDRDLHDLHQRQIWGRAMQTLIFLK